jgi:3D (Asp-Asp-Asp) domain-containing protein
MASVLTRFGALFLVAAAALSVGCGPREQQTTVKATAYNSTRAQTDRHPTQAACGDHLKPGDKVIAVSRDLAAAGLTCGTEVKISGLAGTWKVVDRMAARRKNHIDIYMGRDVRAAREWGVQDVEIKWKPRIRQADARSPADDNRG